MLKFILTTTLYKHPSIPNLFVTTKGQIFKRMPPREDSNGYSLRLWLQESSSQSTPKASKTSDSAEGISTCEQC